MTIGIWFLFWLKIGTSANHGSKMAKSGVHVTLSIKSGLYILHGMGKTKSLMCNTIVQCVLWLGGWHLCSLLYDLPQLTCTMSQLPSMVMRSSQCHQMNFLSPVWCINQEKWPSCTHLAFIITVHLRRSCLICSPISPEYILIMLNGNANDWT